MQPLRILVNYWEVKPAQMKERIEELVQSGVQEVSTFVPWQAFESDISHSLYRFIQVCYNKKLSLCLLPSPEPGIHYRQSGLPKELTQSHDHMAQDSKGKTIPFLMGPKVFMAPSLHSPEFKKRLYGYFSRLHVFLSDLHKNQPKLLQGLSIELSGSFWKYYRSAIESSYEPFEGRAGDFSKESNLFYRKALDQFYRQPEFVGKLSQVESTQRINFLKSSRFEKSNRETFQQQMEEVFRTRCYQLMDKAPFICPVKEIEMYVPEADPFQAYSSVLEKISKGFTDFFRLSGLIDSYATHRVGSVRGVCPPFIHWSTVGGFHRLAEAEKQFLILKSLVLMASQGGGIFIADRDWHALSQVFRTRIETLSRNLHEKRFFLQHQALYLGNHSWSCGSSTWKTFSEMLGHRGQHLAHSGLLCDDLNARLLVVDPSYIVQRSSLKDILDWIRGGRVALIPKNAIYSDGAQKILDELIEQSSDRYQLDVGLPYEILSYPGGKAVLYDYQPDQEHSLTHAWKQFMQSMFGLAGIQELCRVSDSRIEVVNLKRKAGDGRGQGVFVLNHTQSEVNVKLFFNSDANVSDLALSMARELKTDTKSKKQGRQFELEVPAFGVLPLSVEGIVDDQAERLDAALNERTQQDGL